MHASAHLVGGVYNMDFHRALVISNDIWKKTAGGIPQHCFLLATTLEANVPSRDPDDEEVILLRVEGTAKLPRENEPVEVREQVVALAEHNPVDDPGGREMQADRRATSKRFDERLDGLGLRGEQVDEEGYELALGTRVSQR